MKPPAFQFYCADFMMGTMAMSPESVGGYIRMLCFQWDNGPIPDDDALLARITGCDGKAVASIRQKFVTIDGHLVNARLEKVRQGQLEYRAKQAGNAHKRWGGSTKPHAVAQPTLVPDACSPSPSPSPTLTPAPTITPETEGPKAHAKRELPTLEQWTTAARELHPDWPIPDVRNAWEHYEKVGWKSGRTPIVKWRMSIGGCYSRWHERRKRYHPHEAPPIDPRFDQLLGRDQP